MINYNKLMHHNPCVYETIKNSKGQSIDLVEHPLRGGETDVIAVCHELKLADYTGFFDTDDMLAEHKEYEPSFVDGDLYIGEFKYRE